jgi:hypothetical protein
MLNYSDLEMNLYANGNHQFITSYHLSAYGRNEYDQLDTANYITVEIAESDYRCFTSDDDAWYGSGDREYEALLSTFILYQLNEKAK